MEDKQEKKAANSQKKKGATSGSWPKGKSGNPNGRPKEGQSWASTIKRISDMSRDELIEYVGGPRSYYGQMLKRLPANLPVKEMVVLSAVIQQIFDPNPKLFTAVTDREDGKPAQPIVGDPEKPVPIKVIEITKTFEKDE